MKFSEKPGARGGPFLKCLIPINDPETVVHSEKRRRFVRKVLDSLFAYRNTLIPRPLFFDLKKAPMIQEKAKRIQGIVAELLVKDRTFPPKLLNMVGTLWDSLEITHLPLLPNQTDQWNPLSYSPETVFKCTATIGEFQARATKFLTDHIQSKVLNKKTPEDQVTQHLVKKLKHE